MSSPRFRASFSVLNLWSQGNWERAIKSYFKLEKFTTPAMADGHLWHERWKAETLETGCLPKVFGGAKLTNPTVEIKKVLPINEWLDFVFIIDCLDEPTIHEYKTGTQSASAYANSYQIPLYAIGATMMEKYVDRGIIHRLNQHTKLKDGSPDVETSIVWITDKLMADAQEWLMTIASEMHVYFISNDLYAKFGKVEDTVVTNILNQ